MSLRSFQTICCTIAAGLLLVSTTSADDSTSQNKSQAKTAEQWIDQLSTKVDLTSDQKDKIREKLNANGQEVSSTWNKFAEANAKAIALEATMYAAIEDGMSDQQKQQFRKNRRNKQSANKTSQNKRDAGNSSNRDKNDRRSANNDQPHNAANTTGSQQANASNDASRKTAGGSSEGSAASDKQSNQGDTAYILVTETIIVPAQQSVSDMSMDAQQQQKCDRTCQQFHSKLHEAYSDVQRYREQLVQLEAEKLRAVEEVLNDAQLQKLKKDRSSDQAS